MWGKQEEAGAVWRGWRILLSVMIHELPNYKEKREGRVEGCN